MASGRSRLSGLTDGLTKMDRRILDQDRNTLMFFARRKVMAVATVFVFCVSLANFAWASCAAPSPDPECRAEFDLLSSVTWAATKFVTVGHVKGATPSVWTIAVVDLSGRPVPQREISWRRPNGSDDLVAVDFKKILALPQNSIGLIGNLRLAHSSWFSGVVLALGADGKVLWEREVTDPTANYLFQSGTYDPGSNRIIAVGRRTIGNDDGTCTNWSQSYVQGLMRATEIWCNPKSLRVS